MAQPSETVLSVERALLLLQYLAQAEEPIGVRDLASAFGYSPSVTQKLLNSLRRHRFVEQNEQTSRYHLGTALIAIGLAALRHLDLVEVARPHLETLSRETGETTFLAVLDGLQAAYVDKVPSPQPVRMDAPVGSLRPLNCTAVGKVLLAYGSDELLTRLQEEGRFEQPTPQAVAEPALLIPELQRVRREGLALDKEEFYQGATCVAAPIFDRSGQVVAAITASGPSFRVLDNLDAIKQAVRDTAAAVSRALGHRSPGGPEVNGGDD